LFVNTSNILVMKRASLIRLVVLVVGIAAGVAPAFSQYDRDGRYVPSPNGIPRDPYASTIPGYSGTPGGAIGTPTLPRGSIPPPVEVTRPRSAEPLVVLPQPKQRPLVIEQCNDGWSRATGITPVEFKRRCALLKRRARTQ
jgi:hypothetical protein